MATDRRMDYAEPGLPGREPIDARIPGWVAVTAAIVAFTSGGLALLFLEHYLVIKDHIPGRQPWIAPVGAVGAIVAGLIALIPTGEGRRRGVPLTMLGLLGGGLAGLLVLGGPRLIVCGESADRVKCASNLRQIGLAISIYARANVGRYPSDLSTLFAAAGLTADVFCCPMTSHRPKKGDRQTQAASLAGPPHCSYTYVGADLTSAAPADVVVAYEPRENHDGDGANVLFGDGHVGFLTTRELEQVLAKPATAPTLPAPR